MYKRIVTFFCFFISPLTYSQEYDSIQYELSQQNINSILVNTYKATTVLSINKLINNVKDNSIIIVNKFRYRNKIYPFITTINLAPKNIVTLYTGDMIKIDSAYIDNIESLQSTNLIINYFSNNFDSGTIAIMNVASGDIVGLDVLDFFSFTMQQAKNNFNSFPIIVRPLSQIFQFIIQAEINWIEKRF